MDDKYYYFNDGPANNDDAIASCINKGGKLFEPKNEKVNIEVTNLAKDRGLDSFWLGINDKSQENSFVYASDGTYIIYKNWCGPDCCRGTHGEPSGNGDCVWIGVVDPTDELCSDHSMWDDEGCSNVKPFVCEKGELGLYYIMNILNRSVLLHLLSSLRIPFVHAIMNINYYICILLRHH